MKVKERHRGVGFTYVIAESPGTSAQNVCGVIYSGERTRCSLTSCINNVCILRHMIYGGKQYLYMKLGNLL